MLFHQGHEHGKTWARARNADRNFVQRHPTLDTMVRADSLIASFTSAAEAVAAAVRCSRFSPPASGIWSFAGFDASLRVRSEWARRPLVRKLMGAGEEDRIVNRLAEHLENGDTVLILRTKPTAAVLQAFASAASIESIGAWTCRRIR